MHSKGYSYLLALLFCLSSFPLFAQVTVSERFEEVAAAILKDELKKKIYKYTTNKDPIVGIVTRELLEELFETGVDNTTVPIGVNAGLELVYLNYIRLQVEVITAEHPEVIKQANKAKLSEKQLISYASLYYYYSERIKHGLINPTHLNEAEDVKVALEGLKTEEGRKFVTVVSQKLRQGKRDGDYLLDVRLFKFIETYAVGLAADKDATLAGGTASLKELQDSVDYINPDVVTKLIKGAPLYFRKSNKTLVFVSQLYGKIVEQSFKNKSKNTNMSDKQLAFLRDALAGEVQRLFISVLDPGIDQARMTINFKTSLLRLFESWLEVMENNNHGLTYKLTLSGTPLFSDTTASIDFTLMDQIRWYPFVRNNIFLFAGGFVDPIIKTVGKIDGANIYPFGLGIDVNRHLSIGGIAGFPFADIKTLNWYYGINLAYKIPLKYLIKN